MKRHKYYYKEKIKICMTIKYKHQILLYLRNNFYTSLELKQKVFNCLIVKSKKYSFTKLKNFCIYTGRLRFILGNTKMSRITFKEFAAKGNIIGIIKLSW